MGALTVACSANDPNTFCGPAGRFFHNKAMQFSVTGSILGGSTYQWQVTPNTVPITMTVGSSPNLITLQPSSYYYSSGNTG